MDWCGLAARLILGGVLLVAGLLKVVDFKSSVYAVRSYLLLPYDLTELAGYVMPIAEVIIGLMLITGLFTRLSGVLGSLMMVAFIIAIASVWARGISIDCGCFGGGGEIERAAAMAAYPWEILRDIGLFLCGAWLVWRPKSPFALDDVLFPAIPDIADDEDLD